ncbi:hypothetical protein EJ06DRAFT_123030 [Trichodelitschia bisporula]|uniref:Uncharacterized protein n=1 Tax=Trichodelitschia bisporula TaxID=703511 RepID=A0A6G1HQS5_9PEZI|nr:hypothetical protein EJ06DRAFT_123030 [Trichodelitschia bisporula]
MPNAYYCCGCRTGPYHIAYYSRCLGCEQAPCEYCTWVTIPDKTQYGKSPESVIVSSPLSLYMASTTSTLPDSLTSYGTIPNTGSQGGRYGSFSPSAGNPSTKHTPPEDSPDDLLGGPSLIQQRSDVWYCCDCGDGPVSVALHAACVGCDHHRCMGCKSENRAK